MSIWGGGGGGGGATNFLALTDTPASYSGQAGKAAVVNPGETGIAFEAIAGGGGDYTVQEYTAPGTSNLGASEYGKILSILSAGVQLNLPASAPNGTRFIFIPVASQAVTIGVNGGFVPGFHSAPGGPDLSVVAAVELIAYSTAAFPGLQLWIANKIGNDTNWSGTEMYSIGSVVFYTSDQRFYKSKVNQNIGNQPDESPTQWAQITKPHTWRAIIGVDTASLATTPVEILADAAVPAGYRARITSFHAAATTGGISGTGLITIAENGGGQAIIEIQESALPSLDSDVTFGSVGVSSKLPIINPLSFSTDKGFTISSATDGTSQTILIRLEGEFI